MLACETFLLFEVLAVLRDQLLLLSYPLLLLLLR
jgi:hypothetical protein